MLGSINRRLVRLYHWCAYYYWSWKMRFLIWRRWPRESRATRAEYYRQFQEIGDTRVRWKQAQRERDQAGKKKGGS